MKVRLLKGLLVIAVILLTHNFAYGQRNLCDIPDVGTLAPNEFKTKTSIMHIWQGAVGGVNTKNADRIIGLYDFDLYYLYAAQEADNNDGDYILFCVSNQGLSSREPL